jgi:hypothetical protein
MADYPLTTGVFCSVLCAEKCADVADYDSNRKVDARKERQRSGLVLS